MTKSPLDLAAEGLYRELSQSDNDISKLPEVTRPIALLYMFQGIVDNGGFRYPMENDFPGNPPYSSISYAYRKIGAIEAGDALDRAAALFQFDKPEQNAEARNQFLDSLEDGNEFEEMGNRVCGDEAIWRLMDEYVAKHNKDFAPLITK